MDIKEIRARAQFAYSAYSLTLCGPSAHHRAINSFLRTPMIGDLVLEITTANYKLLDHGSDSSGFGRLVDRLYNMDIECPPVEQPYSYYHYRIRPEVGSPEVNWTNASFIVAVDWYSLRDFEQLAYGRPSLFPQKQFSYLDESTWWWLKAARDEEQRMLARTKQEIGT